MAPYLEKDLISFHISSYLAHSSDEPGKRPNTREIFGQMLVVRIYLHTVSFLNFDSDLEAVDRVECQTFVSKQRLVGIDLGRVHFFEAQAVDDELLELALKLRQGLA